MSRMMDCNTFISASFPRLGKGGLYGSGVTPESAVAPTDACRMTLSDPKYSTSGRSGATRPVARGSIYVAKERPDAQVFANAKLIGPAKLAERPSMISLAKKLYP